MAHPRLSSLALPSKGSICMSTPFRIKSWWNLLVFHRHLIRLVQLWSCLDFIFSIFGSFNFHNIHEILSRLSTAAKKKMDDYEEGIIKEGKFSSGLERYTFRFRHVFPTDLNQNTFFVYSLNYLPLSKHCNCVYY